MTEKDYFGWEEMKKEDPCWTGCDSLEKAIDGCNNLEELFRLWQIAQAHETEDPKSDSFPNLSLAKCSGLTFSDTFASSFCPDGFLIKKAKPEVPVLFICRESNISGNIKECPEKGTKEIVGNIGQEQGDEPLFWLREVVDCKNKGQYFKRGKVLSTPEKTAQTKYYNCLLKLLCHLKKKSLIDKDVKPKDCAYININKRGGFDGCDQSKLAVYAERYHLFIQKEISIIKPKHIVVCGELNDDDLRKVMKRIFQTCGYHVYWVYPKHPSCYTMEAFKDFVAKTIN